jgi:undecaprenyl-diphosphatase
MNFFEYIILGILQGIAEIFPVSSSGHLALAEKIISEKLIGIIDPLKITVFLHFGSAIAILFVFRQDIWNAIYLFTQTIQKSKISPRKYRTIFRENSASKLPFFVILSFICTCLIALPFKKFVLSAFDNPMLVGLMLILSGFILILAFQRVEQGNKLINNISLSDALIIGFAQGIAVVPGISRLGITFLATLLLKMEKADGAKYSFLLAFLTIISANIYEMVDSFTDISNLKTDWLPMILGLISATIASYWAIKFFMNKVILKKRNLLWFAVYCFLIGAGVVVYTQL